MLENRDILVSIASYCDEQLALTVEDLLDKCSNPERLDIVIINQSEEPENLPYENVLEMWVDHKKARGVSWARSQIVCHINKYHRYFLQIDAHCRFYQDWDLTMISNLDDEWDVISTFPYPHDYIPVNEPPREYRPWSTNRFTHKTSDGALAFGGGPVPDKESMRPSSISASMIFSHIKFLKDVPIDPRMGWNHEQSDLTIRAFLKGYNIKAIEHPPVTHIYGKCHARQERTNATVVTEMPSYSDDVRTIEQLEVLYGINYETGDKEAMITILVDPPIEGGLRFWKEHLSLYGFTAHSKTLFLLGEVPDEFLEKKIPHVVGTSMLDVLADMKDDQIVEILPPNQYHRRFHKKYRLAQQQVVTNSGRFIMRADTARDFYSSKEGPYEFIIDPFDHI